VQGVQLVTIKELLGHTHVRLRRRHDAINQLTDVLQDDDNPEDPPIALAPANRPHHAETPEPPPRTTGGGPGVR
jgi:hypothetical protein